VFELAVFTDDIDQDLDRALDVAQQLGVRWVEIRSAWGKNLVDQPETAIVAVRNAIQARGLRVRCVPAPLLKCTLRGAGEASREQFFAQDRDSSQQMELLRKAIHIARLFDTSLIRCFSFWRIPGELAAIWDELLEQFRQPIHLAEHEGVTLVLENDFECNLGTGADTARFIAAVDSPHLRVLWDPGNAHFVGEEAYPAGYGHVRGLIDHVHVKDAVRDPATKSCRWVSLGSGEVDLLGQLQALRADGYTDVVTLENHYTPAGGTKEDGVRESFRGLQRLVQQVER